MFGRRGPGRCRRSLRLADAQSDRVGGQRQDLREGDPSLLGDAQDPTLQAACIEMCSSLYPGKALEVPDMIMRGAYGHIKYHRQDYHGMASLVDAAMSRIIPDSADALFSVGYARV